MPPRVPLLCLYAISGFCTLTLETLWMRVATRWAGHTVVAAAEVLIVFFAAAALGNLWGARLVARRATPLRYYGRCEVAAGLAAVATFSASAWFPQTWLATLLLVGPPSFLSGVAFPCLAEAFVPSADRRTAEGGPFYGMNLLGAALGVALGGVLLPWWVGIRAAFGVGAGLQIAAGLSVWALARNAAPRPHTTTTTPRGVWFGWGLLASTGLLALAAQSLLIVWVRQALEGSIYAIAGVLAVFIGGLGLGALLAARLRAKGHAPNPLLAAFAMAGALMLFGVAAFGASAVSRRFDLTGSTPPAMLAQTLGGSALWLLPLTVALGGIFPVAWELARSHTPHEGRVLGCALAANKLGAAVGALAGMFVLLPACGLVRGTQIVAWAYLGIAAVFAMQTGNRMRWEAMAIAAIGLWACIRTRPSPDLVAGLNPIAEYSGSYGPVAVAEDRTTGSRQIVLNTRQRLNGTGRALSSQRHQSWVPLTFCRTPGRVMTIGMASGISAAAALDFPVQELHAIELVPEVVRAAREHFGEWNAALFTDPRVRIHLGDGRAVLARQPGKFDAIICDLFFPAEDGAANLYTREFFADVRSRLNTGGVFCLWLPCYQHTADTAGSIVRTFADAFPHALLVRANLDPIQPVLGLLGANDPLPVSREFLTGRTSDRSPFFRSVENAWLLLAGDLHAAEPDFATHPPVTDDHPRLAWLGPRQPPPRERLVGMTFLDWIGRRFTRPQYPSFDLGATPPEEILAAVRAANFYFAAAVADSVLPGDTRNAATREQHVAGYLTRARELHPRANFPREALGR